MKIQKLKLRPMKQQNNGFNNPELNIFEMGTLVQVETSSWQARKQVPKEITQKITPESKRNLIRANKDLIDRDHLKRLNSIITNTRRFVSDVSNPFPIKGLHFVSAKVIDLVTMKLDEFKTQLAMEVDLFLKEYESYKSEVKQELNKYKLYDERDYPSEKEIRESWTISYRFFDLSIPKHITNELRQKEEDEFKKLMNETKELGILALREGFNKIVSHLVGTLQGKLKGEGNRLHQEAIDNVYNFFKTFENRNVFNDTQLEKLIKDAQNILEGVTTDDLKSDDSFAKILTNELEKVQKETDKCVSSFKRKLSFR